MKKVLIILFCVTFLTELATAKKICISNRDIPELNKVMNLYKDYLDSVNFKYKEVVYILGINKGNEKSYTLSFVYRKSILLEELLAYSHYYNYNGDLVLLVGDYKIDNKINNVYELKDEASYSDLYEHVIDDTKKGVVSKIVWMNIQPAMVYTLSTQKKQFYLQRKDLPKELSPHNFKTTEEILLELQKMLEEDKK